MAYPSSVKSFTTKVDGVDQILAAHMNDVQTEIAAVETDLLAPPLDISSTTTTVGWSSFSTKSVWYRVIGNRCFVDFVLHGTSDATTASFTVPVTCNASYAASYLAIMRGRDNAVYEASIAYITAGDNKIQGGYTTAGSAWTASGSKMMQGQIWFYI